MEWRRASSSAGVMILFQSDLVGPVNAESVYEFSTLKHANSVFLLRVPGNCIFRFGHMSVEIEYSTYSAFSAYS